MLSQAASLHPLVQRTGPVLSWSQRSSCSPGAGSSPAWLTMLTSEPPCPSRSLYTSAAPAHDGVGKGKWSRRRDKNMCNTSNISTNATKLTNVLDKAFTVLNG